jgi:hypothetical protein
MRIYVFKHVSVTLVTINRVSYNKNTTTTQIIVRKCTIKAHYLHLVFSSESNGFKNYMLTFLLK